MNTALAASPRIALPDNPNPEQVLYLIEQCHTALAYVETPHEARGIVDRAQALVYLAKKSHQAFEVQNQAAEVSLRAQREAGKVTAALDKAHPGSPSPAKHLGNRVLPKSEPSIHLVEPKIIEPPAQLPKAEALAEAGISKMQASRWERIAKLDDDTFETFIGVSNDERREITTAAALAMANTGIMGASEGVEWYTPSKYIEAARRVMGGIDLDPASSEIANRVVRAERYYTSEQNGLELDWQGRIFMNPPFGDVGPLFVARLLSFFEQGAVTEAILLCAVRIETRWYQPLLNHLVCFPDHRVLYYQEGRTPAPAFASSFTYLGPNRDAFIHEFLQFGPVMRRADHG